jgi:hypothetical protein
VIATHHRRPGFLAAALGAIVSSFLAWIVVALLALPLAMVAATGSAIGPAGSRDLAALSIGALLLVLVAQPLVAAGLLRALLSAAADSELSFGTAALAMFAFIIVSLLAAAALPADAALPVLGYSWAGALTAGWIVSR